MPTRAVRIFPGSVVARTAVLLSAWLVALASGCAHRVYSPTKLPTELAAPRPEKVSPDLVSRLAPPAVMGEVIDRGDLLEVTIDDGHGEQSARTTPVWVQEDGTVRVPLIGNVPLAGLRLQDAGRAIAAAGIERGLYVDPYPYVTVEMKQQRKNRVTVIGAVKDPGEKELPRSSSHLLAALVAAGNLTENASSELDIIRCARGNEPLSPQGPLMADGPQAGLASYAQSGPQGPRTIRVSLISATQQDQAGYYLEDGDVVVVREREPRSIHVMGLVKNPGEYDLPAGRDVRLLSALAAAGGRTSQLADTVWIIRQVPGKAESARIRASVRKAKRDGAENPRLMGGDVITVEETPVTFLEDLLKRLLKIGVPLSVPL